MARTHVALGVLLLLDFIVAVTILFTDHNLQTDFGLVTHSYFIHWYGMLAISIVSIIGALVSFFSGSRGVATAGAIGATLVFLFLLADVLTAPSLGLSYTAFAKYLFGIPPYVSASGYIPGLYDVLVVLFLVTAVVGFRSRSKHSRTRASS